MNFIAENWYMLLIGLVVLAGAVFAIVQWARRPNPDKIQNLKEWLRYAVVEAERRYGNGTGELKLRAVYDWAITKFPWLAAFIQFEQFSQWVDEALDWLKDKLEEKPIDVYIHS